MINRHQSIELNNKSDTQSDSKSETKAETKTETKCIGSESASETDFGSKWSRIWCRTRMAHLKTMSAAAPGVEVDPALEAAIAGGLKGSPKDRHRSAEAFRSALAAPLR